MLYSEAVADNHERRMRSRWPRWCLEGGSGGCEFCSCHLPKRAVELLQGGAIPHGLAGFASDGPDNGSQGFKGASSGVSFLGALQRLSVSEFMQKTSASGRLNSTPLWTPPEVSPPCGGGSDALIP